MARGTKDINHAQFVDDIVLLGGASQLIARRFKTENGLLLPSFSKQAKFKKDLDLQLEYKPQGDVWNLLHFRN